MNRLLVFRDINKTYVMMRIVFLCKIELTLEHSTNGSRWQNNSIWKLGSATDVIRLPVLTLLMVTDNVSGTTTMPPMVPNNQTMTPMSIIKFPWASIFALAGNFCQSISNDSILRWPSGFQCQGWHRLNQYWYRIGIDCLQLFQLPRVPGLKKTIMEKSYLSSSK